jgi:ADP-ribose pyrophosphatase
VTAIRRLRRDVLYTGKVFDLLVDQVAYPSGATGVREIARHPGGAVVVPLLDNGDVVLVRQWRWPIEGTLLELPAGKLAPGEEPAACAERELAEETGWVAGRLELLTRIYTTPGFCDEVLHIFRGTSLRPSPAGHAREEGEREMTIHTMPLADAAALVRRGEIRDAKTIIGILLTAGDREEGDPRR